MGICWSCYWGWPAPVAAIYSQAVAQLGGNDTVLHFGPSHIVWADENFDDDNIISCLKQCDEWNYEYNDDSPEDIAVVRQSLEALLALPEPIRCAEPDDYDGEHPELFPPPPGATFLRLLAP